MIVKMKKLNIVGLIAQKKAVLDVLRSTGCFELTKTDIFEGQRTGDHSVDHAEYEKLCQRLHTVENAISAMESVKNDFANQLKTAKKLHKKGEIEAVGFKLPKQKKPLFFARTDVTADQLNKAGENGEQSFKNALDVLAKKEQIEQLNQQFEANIRQLTQLNLYKNVGARISDIKDSKYLFMLLGTITLKNAKKAIEQLSGRENFACDSFVGIKKQSILFVSGPIEQKDEVEEILHTLNFTQHDLDCQNIPLEEINNLKKQNNEIIFKKLSIYNEIAVDQQLEEDLKFFHDFLILEIEAQDAQKSIGETQKTYSIEGWVPAENASEIVEKVKSVSNMVECEILDQPDTLPPTLTRNNALVSPYEAVTNMYSPPSPLERDPNPFVAIFFFFFFGIMIGDAVYGVALFVLTFILLRCYKMETGFKKLMMIICMGGISAFIWGAVYNSWAAIGLPYNPILNPVEHPFDFLIISLGFGYIQIMFGFSLKLVANLKARDYVSALADSGWKLMILLGGVLNFPNTLSSFENQFYVIKMPNLPSFVSYIGLGLIFAGLVGMLLTGGRHKSSIGGKILSGVGSWYDLVGILSDILSYCRLFGLALSGAIIGMVANILAKDVLFNIPVVGYALGIAVAVFFHIFNLALACLGAYVHNSRLQFVEFFGKFYEGGGTIFKPMGHGTKYTKIKH